MSCSKNNLSLILVVFLCYFIFVIFARPIPVFAAGESWLTGFTYRRQLTIDHTKVGLGTEDETDFPVLVSLSGLANINDSGTDIRFTDSSGATQLAREIESYSGGVLVAWVKIPTLSHDVNTIIYMYYGNAAAGEPAADSEYGSQNVWTNDYIGVWHLGSSLTADSTANKNNGTNNGAGATTGKVGAAADFVFDVGSGTGDYISVADNPDLNPDQFTIEYWVKTEVFYDNSWNAFVAKENWDGGVGGQGWFFYRGIDGAFNFLRSQHDTPPDISTGITNGWHF